MMGVHALVDKNGVVQEDISMTVADSSGSSSSPAQDIPAASPKTPQRSSRQSKRRYIMCRQWDNARNIKKGAGIRQTRRSEDLQHLMCLVEELDEVDIVEPTCSAFTALFMEHEKMKAWNDFLNRPEEAQQQLLQQGGFSDEEEEDEERGKQEEGEEEETDGRQEHPAFSAAECFSRIDSRLKSYLGRNHVPMGTLEHLEADLMEFFNDFPTSVLITKLGSSFERLLLHALCQYLDLSSHSFDDTDTGRRHTQVENKQEQFTPPNMTLTQYLEQDL